MINIVIPDIYTQEIEPGLIEKTVLAITKHENLSYEVDVSIVLESDEGIQKLNAQFRGIDSPTDVLSFSSEDIDPETGKRYLGDIIISYPRAMAQAELAGHSVKNEVQLLIIHGMLHLMGYDHDTETNKKDMWQKQDKLLKNLSVNITRLPEE